MEKLILKSCEIRITGIVQGVGFRPFIYKLALTHGISGWVLNDTAGVLIRAEGNRDRVDAFISGIKSGKPEIAAIDDIVITPGKFSGIAGFEIEESRLSQERSAFIPPDIALCPDCLREFFSPDDRRHLYPFITCINCGPRFSIIRDVPYDRARTSMDTFGMCDKCGSEYTGPMDRRFHAQPIACRECGPRLSLYDSRRNLVADDGPGTIAAMTKDLLYAGSIVAIKGIGGYHLAANAMDDDAVKRLRQLKGRPFKPFALMAGDINFMKTFLHISERESGLLLSMERPVVLLKEKAPLVSRLISPGLTYTGVMLPYTPFQHHLFSMDREMVLIMTSGNISEEPIAYDDDDAFARLGGIAGYFVTYNREIVAHSDDSVMFVEDSEPYFIRRSRGFVPVPFRSVKPGRHLLAMGGDLKNCFALSKEDIIIVSQHLGDLATPSGYGLFRNVLNHYRRIFDFSPEAVIADLHPGYFTGKIAADFEQAGLTRFNVQHHHAHIASVMEEHGLDENIIGIAFDGTGYGTDGTLWGSEFLVCGRRDFIRAGHFTNFPLPGGERAIHSVWKIGLSLLHDAYGRDIPLMRGEDDKTAPVMDLIEKKIHSPLTCSIGRIFDGVSAILGISREISSEAEAAMLLEEAALRAATEYKSPFIINFTDGETFHISTSSLIRYIADLMMKKIPFDEIALHFHRSIAGTAVAVAEKLRERFSLNKIALSGGVFQNRLLLRMVMGGLKEKKFEVFVNRKVPSNDGSIALGQIAIGKELINT